MNVQILQTVVAMRSTCKAARRADKTLGLVPTMGALHEGHLSLIRAARRICDFVAVTIFVNPLQFGPNEDFGRYPRTFDEDCDMVEREGVDVLFAPTREEMYPEGMETWVDVPNVGGRLDGASRPGHFRGVATVVAKLFHLAQPDKAFFGQKDAAQVAVLQRMVQDLNFDVELVVCPTVRDEDGVALSSRNKYLSGEERRRAQVLSRSLRQVSDAAKHGEIRSEALRKKLMEGLREDDGLKVDYAELVDPRTLEPIEEISGGALVAVAAWVGGTRLIDNIVLPDEKAVEAR